MRTICAVVVLLFSAHAASASERVAFFDRLARLDAAASLTAFQYLECTESATKDAASRDIVTPSRLMADWAAKEGARQCASRGSALIAWVGWMEATRLKATAYRVNVETALQVRRGKPVLRR
jgi:hypothetical protein